MAGAPHRLSRLQPGPVPIEIVSFGVQLMSSLGELTMGSVSGACGLRLDAVDGVEYTRAGFPMGPRVWAGPPPANPYPYPARVYPSRATP